MKSIFVIAGLAACLAAPAFAADDAQDVIHGALTEMNNNPADGNAVAIYQKWLDPNCFYVQENDTISTKADMVKDAATPPPKGINSHIDVDILNFSRDGDVAVAVARDHETENFFGQTLHATYLYTSTWRLRPEGWRMLSEQVLAEPIDPPSVTLPPEKLADYVGSYKLRDSDMVYTVTLKDGVLTGTRAAKSVPLNAELADVFFVSGQPRIRKIFQRDASGKISGFVDRREGRDVVWRKV